MNAISNIEHQSIGASTKADALAGNQTLAVHHLALLDQHLQDAAVEVDEDGSPCSTYMLELAQRKLEDIHAGWHSLPRDRQIAHLFELSCLTLGVKDARDCNAARRGHVNEAVSCLGKLLPEAAAKPARGAVDEDSAAGSLTLASPVKRFGSEIHDILMTACASSVLSMLEQMEKMLEGEFTDVDVEERFYIHHARATQIANFLYGFHGDDLNAGPSLEEVAKATRYDADRLLGMNAAREAA